MAGIIFTNLDTIEDLWPFSKQCAILHIPLVRKFHILVRIPFFGYNEIGALIRFGFRPSLGGT